MVVHALNDEPARESWTARAAFADFFNMTDFPGKRNICPLRQRPEELLALTDKLERRALDFACSTHP